MQGFQGFGEAENGVTPLLNRKPGPDQIESLAGNPAKRHPGQALDLTRCLDDRVRNRGRERVQQSALTSKSLPVSSPAHPEHQVVR